MLRGSVGIVVAIGLFVGMCTPAAAFDGSRKGFILGIGVGPSVTSFTQDLTGLGQDLSSDRENEFGLATDFKLGYAPNEQLQIYWASKVSWFALDNALGETVTVANGLGGAGVSWYLVPQSPSVYFTGAIGFSSWAVPFEEGATTSYGFGIAGGAGYEFAKHWSVEGLVGFGNPSDTEGDLELTTKALSARVTINVLGY